jgi:hypothetical protein
MSYTFHPEAEVEFLQAIDYYEDREQGLGLGFALEVYAAVEHAEKHPRAWPILAGDVRRCQTVRFPYGILYSEETNGIFVLAVMHLHRDPEYWQHRLG